VPSVPGNGRRTLPYVSRHRILLISDLCNWYGLARPLAENLTPDSRRHPVCTDRGGLHCLANDLGLRELGRGGVRPNLLCEYSLLVCPIGGTVVSRLKKCIPKTDAYNVRFQVGATCAEEEPYWRSAS